MAPLLHHFTPVVHVPTSAPCPTPPLHDLRLKQSLSSNVILTYHSGPAKGYIEGLEHRLHEAETLLLQVLPLIPSDQLASAANAANDVSQHGVSRDSPD